GIGKFTASSARPGSSSSSDAEGWDEGNGGATGSSSGVDGLTSSAQSGGSANAVAPNGAAAQMVSRTTTTTLTARRSAFDPKTQPTAAPLQLRRVSVASELRRKVVNSASLRKCDL